MSVKLSASIAAICISLLGQQASAENWNCVSITCLGEGFACPANMCMDTDNGQVSQEGRFIGFPVKGQDDKYSYKGAIGFNCQYMNRTIYLIRSDNSLKVSTDNLSKEDEIFQHLCRHGKVSIK